MSAKIAAGVVALATLRAHELQLACVQSFVGSQVSKLEITMVIETLYFVCFIWIFCSVPCFYTNLVE